MQIFPFFQNLAIPLFSEIVIFMINWYQDFVMSNFICNHTCDKQIGLQLCGHLILLSIVWLQTELDSTKSYYLYLLLLNKLLQF